eukprot:TRINITY_DN12483_c0_g1_i1.p1 TRINITY_DN12483_c0_g1~~TRINITY_DN12483_c0_g1_i1.p1  ORF type:complete len:133 (-),score=3.35 TRINITY_DN12483_c0_g1_i1:31-429(-)
MFDSIAWGFVVALIWGVSNCFIKKGGEGVNKHAPKSDSKIKNVVNEMLYLLKQPLLLFSMAVNQLGSLVFYLALSNQDISLIVPITNSMTFLVTTITSQLLGEEGIDRYTYLGMVCVLAGVFTCIISDPDHQ